MVQSSPPAQVSPSAAAFTTAPRFDLIASFRDNARSPQERDVLFPLLNRCRRWREQGWTSIDAEDYQAAWQRWGGSVITHPEIVQRLSDFLGAPLSYLGWQAGDGELAAALPV